MIMRVHVTFVGMLVVVIFMVVLVFMRMLVIPVLMHVLIFFNAIYNYVRMRAFDTALDALFETICDIGNANGIKLFFARLNAARKLGQ